MSATDLAQATAVPAEPASTRARKSRGIRLESGGLVPGGILLLIAVLAILAPWVAPYDPIAQDITARLKSPIWSDGAAAGHLLGTDQLGRDTLSRIIYGGRVSLAVGFAGVLISTIIGTAAGVLAGYSLGWVDRIVMRLVDIQLAFPRVLLAIAMIGVMGASVTNLVLVLGISGWVDYTRIVRAQLLSIREKEYILAARALGLPDWRIMWFHSLPNIMSPVIIIGSVSVATNIILESSLSYLGLGVGASAITWGTMMSDANAYIGVQGWLATFPGLAIMVTVLAVNLLGDWLRDVLDPRLRQ